MLGWNFYRVVIRLLKVFLSIFMYVIFFWKIGRGIFWIWKVRYLASSDLIGYMLVNDFNKSEYLCSIL